ncbi:hypothetical protein AgCh_006344 [Apium graveolens]
MKDNIKIIHPPDPRTQCCQHVDVLPPPRAPIPEDQEFSGPYTERDSESSDDDVAPRRRRADKEPMPDGDPDDPTPPFTEEIMSAHISRKFKMPTIKAYDGTGDPDNHVRTFSNALLLQPVNDAIKCRAFPQTLSGMAQRCERVHERRSASLMSIVQGAKESLRYYLNRFTKEALKVPDLDDKLQDRAGKYIKVEESMRKTVVNNEPVGGKKRKTDLEYIAKDKYPRTEQNTDSTPKKGGPGQKFTEYAKLNAPRSQILMEIEKDRDIHWPKPLKADPTKLDKNKYCRFHKDAVMTPMSVDN